jgi:TonB family protein
MAALARWSAPVLLLAACASSGAASAARTPAAVPAKPSVPSDGTAASGDGTLPSVGRRKYALYFNRIKKALARQWDPSGEMRRRMLTPERLGIIDKAVTVVAVTLDETGALKDVTLTRRSGADFLDELALDAFRKAQPFSDPPAGLSDTKGEIRFSFGFSFEATRRPAPGVPATPPEDPAKPTDVERTIPAVPSPSPPP